MWARGRCGTLSPCGREKTSADRPPAAQRGISQSGRRQPTENVVIEGSRNSWRTRMWGLSGMQRNSKHNRIEQMRRKNIQWRCMLKNRHENESKEAEDLWKKHSDGGWMIISCSWRTTHLAEWIDFFFPHVCFHQVQCMRQAHVMTKRLLLCWLQRITFTVYQQQPIKWVTNYWWWKKSMTS